MGKPLPRQGLVSFPCIFGASRQLIFECVHSFLDIVAQYAAISGKIFPSYHWNVAGFEGGLEGVLVQLDWGEYLPGATCQFREEHRLWEM